VMPLLHTPPTHPDVQYMPLSSFWTLAVLKMGNREASKPLRDIKDR